MIMRPVFATMLKAVLCNNLSPILAEHSRWNGLLASGAMSESPRLDHRCIVQKSIEASRNGLFFACMSFDLSTCPLFVSRALLISKLVDLYAPVYLIQLVDQWLRARTFKVQFRGCESVPHDIDLGIPQGSPLSLSL